MIWANITLHSTIFALLLMSRAVYGIRGLKDELKTNESFQELISKGQNVRNTDPSGSVKYSVVCPGTHEDDYCDCGGDCGNHEGFCDCDEAKVCCRGARETVLCPNMHARDYCDCAGDCGGSFCYCPETKTPQCCGEDSDSDYDYDYDRDYDYDYQAHTTIS